MNFMGIMKAGEWWIVNQRFPAYLVGSHGAVISCIKSPKILSPIRMGAYDGYNLKNNEGKLTKVYRHRLVAETFIGVPEYGDECRHLDGDKTNCDITNLRWGTHQQNELDKLKHGTRIKGEKHPASKLTYKAVSEMKEMRKQGEIFREISKAFGVSTMTAYRAINNQSWVK